MLCRNCGGGVAIKKECHNLVPKTYAKSKIKQFVMRLSGINTKSDTDKEAFIERFQEIKDFRVGHRFAINSIRKDGEYGQEYRDALNLSVCMGMMKKTRQSNNTEMGYYEVWERIDGVPCSYSKLNEPQKNKCGTCKRLYSVRQEKCFRTSCMYIKGPKKGKYRELKIIRNAEAFCKLPPGRFTPISTREKEEEEDY